MSDDLKGAEIAQALDAIIDRKSKESVFAMVLLGMLAGAYIGFGAIGATTITAYAETMPLAITKFLAGSVFSMGLILVMIPGSELFTGNILMAAGLANRKVSLPSVLKNWLFVYSGNFIGAVLLAWAMYGTGLMGTPADLNDVGAKAAGIADMRIGMPFSQALVRGILCNMLVCLAVIMAIASRSVTGKIAAIYFPIMMFVLCGFEHSIANMYFLSAGLMAKGQFVSGFFSMFHNLIPVTIGNIIGGLLVLLLHPARLRGFAKSFA